MFVCKNLLLNKAGPYAEVSKVKSSYCKRFVSKSSYVNVRLIQGWIGLSLQWKILILVEVYVQKDFD